MIRLRGTDPAFPFSHREGGVEAGVSKREWIATMLLIGILANPRREAGALAEVSEEDEALRRADRLLAKLSE